MSVAFTSARLAGLAAISLALAGCPGEEGRLSQLDTSQALPALCPSELDPCAEESATSCSDGRLRTCREDSAGCLGWSAPLACPPNQACLVTACEAACPDAGCSVPEARRCALADARRIERCADADGDGCLEWVAARDCTGEQVCSQGTCASTCTDDCAAGARCEGTAVVTCADHDQDGCLEWGAPTPCDVGCLLGACVDSCRNECPAADITRCDGPSVETCAIGSDGCLHWNAPLACPPGTTCSLGLCATSCADECEPGTTTCEAGGVVACGDFDDDPCDDRGLPVACPEGESCSAGACAATCSDECSATTCAGNALVPCGDFDGDPCRDAGTKVACSAGSSCRDGACEADPAPQGVKIAEVVYQSEGLDNETFIEIGGPAGTSLTGFMLIAVNGDDGAEAGRFVLTGALDSSGRYVIAHPGATAAIADWGDVTSTFADLQNGPDNLLLRWGSVTVDALGYGDFTASDVFTGEGDPAPGADAGFGLARIGQLQDTDDNAVDFAIAAATPGRGYELALRPSFEGDLIVTEVQIDPKALPDNSGEWIELWNPSPDIAWELEGCLIESDPAEAHAISGSLVVPPLGYAVLARSGSVGFVADYVYGGIALANDGDALALTCDDGFIDLVMWDASFQGSSRSLDPAMSDAFSNDLADAWCAAPVTAAAGSDAGTPGAPNPPCGTGGTYESTALDATWGSCDPTGGWLTFLFEGAPAAVAAGTLDFEWSATYCELFAESAAIAIEIKTGTSWTPVGRASFADEASSCQWLGESLTLQEGVIDAARATSGRIEGRFRIEAGCPLGVGCGTLGQVVPYDCGRSFRLSYPY